MHDGYVHRTSLTLVMRHSAVGRACMPAALEMASMVHESTGSDVSIMASDSSMLGDVHERVNVMRHPSRVKVRR